MARACNSWTPVVGCQDTLEKELEAAKTAATSLESSKAALEAEQQEQKDLVASLEEKLQEQKRLTDLEAEAKAALEAKLEEAQASGPASKSELDTTGAAEPEPKEDALADSAESKLPQGSDTEDSSW